MARDNVPHGGGLIRLRWRRRRCLRGSASWRWRGCARSSRRLPTGNPPLTSCVPGGAHHTPCMTCEKRWQQLQTGPGSCFSLFRHIVSLPRPHAVVRGYGLQWCAQRGHGRLLSCHMCHRTFVWHACGRWQEAAEREWRAKQAAEADTAAQQQAALTAARAEQAAHKQVFRLLEPRHVISCACSCFLAGCFERC